MQIQYRLRVSVYSLSILYLVSPRWNNLSGCDCRYSQTIESNISSGQLVLRKLVSLTAPKLMQSKNLLLHWNKIFTCKQRSNWSASNKHRNAFVVNVNVHAVNAWNHPHRLHFDFGSFSSKFNFASTTDRTAYISCRTSYRTHTHTMHANSSMKSQRITFRVLFKNDRKRKRRSRTTVPTPP